MWISEQSYSDHLLGKWVALDLLRVGQRREDASTQVPTTPITNSDPFYPTILTISPPLTKLTRSPLSCPLHNPKSQLVLPCAWKKKRTEERREKVNQRSSKTLTLTPLAHSGYKREPSAPPVPLTRSTLTLKHHWATPLLP